MAFKAVNNYGLDAELAEKMNAKYDKALEEDLQRWIEDTTGIVFNEEFGEMLKTGVVLCELVNKLLPGKIKKINQAGGLFRFQENITNFLRVCREVGVPEASLFPTESLAQLKDMNQVLTCINAFRQHVGQSKSVATGKKLKPSSEAKPLAKSGKKKSKWEVKPGGSSAVSKLNMGSAGVMEETKYQNARDGIMRNQEEWKGAQGEVSAWNKGSAEHMEETKYSDAREQIKRNQLDGKGSGNEVSALNQGSKGMERLQYVDPREQIKRGEL